MSRHRGRVTSVLVAAAVLAVLPATAARGDGAADPRSQQIARGLRTPPGFLAHTWASIPAPTAIAWGPDGALYATSLNGRVYRAAPTSMPSAAPAAPVVEGLSQPLGLAFGPGGELFVSESHSADGRTWGRVVAVDLGTGEREVVVDRLPNGRHNTNDLTIGPDGLLYITNGNNTDNGLECGPEMVPGQDVSCAEPERQPWSGSLLRVDPAVRGVVVDDTRDDDVDGIDIVATGMRNLYDVAFHPVVGDAWVPTNGPDSPAADDVLYRIPTAPAGGGDDPDEPTPPARPGRSGDAPGRNREGRPGTSSQTAAAVDPGPADGDGVAPQHDGHDHGSAPITDGAYLHLGFPSCLYNAHENMGILEAGSHHEHGHSLEPMDNPNDDVLAAFGPCPKDEVLRPVATFGGHVSANGLAFAHGSAFPGTYGNDLFVAEWGNLWGLEDGHVAGHKIVRVNLRDDGSVVHPDDHRADHGDGHDGHAAAAAGGDDHEHDDEGADDHHAVSAVSEFATGGLPIDIAFGPDGAMYVADMAGVIHRVAWVGNADPPDDEDGMPHHDHGEHRYQEVDCPGDVGDAHVLERREHHGNGRTECVIVDGDLVYFCGNAYGDCYVAYDPYQQDETPGNSAHDRGPAIRYHNNDIEGDDHHHAGAAGCWDNDPNSPYSLEEASTLGKQRIQQHLDEALSMYTGDGGLAAALADGWYPYPVPESKQLHMIRQFWAGDRHPDEPKAMHARNIESFVIGMTDDGWQIMNGMFMLGNDGGSERVRQPVPTEQVWTPDGWREFLVAGEYDYKQYDDESILPLWKDPTPGSNLVCDLPWHGHDGEEGVATSFDPDYPSLSAWMAHVGLYAADGDPFAENRGYDSSEPHAYWEPYRHVPALCNPSGPCL